MRGLITLLALGAGGYWLYKKATSQPVAGSLPPDATQVQTLNIAGIPVNVYMASSGYYAQYPKLNGNGELQTIGPYSQAQVSALLNAQSALGNLSGVL